LVAPDGHRLVRHDICDAPEGSADMPDIIIPSGTVSVLRHMLKPTYEGTGKNKVRTSPETLTLTINCVRMRFEFGAHTLITKLIDGTFPDYQRVIPSRNDKRLTVNPEALTRLVNRVSMVSSERGRAVKLQIFDSSVVASVCNPDAGDAKARLDGVDYDGAPLEIGMNGRYLTSALGLFTGPVTIRFNDAGSPVTITDHGQTLTVLMPMRV
jgi:DNA polymerase III subunit beta